MCVRLHRCSFAYSILSVCPWLCDCLLCVLLGFVIASNMCLLAVWLYLDVVNIILWLLTEQFPLFPTGKNASMKCLHESASGLLITRCGNPPPLRYFADNSFHFAHDNFCVNDATGRLINATQKPVVFFGKLIDLYTTAGEWVFDGLSGTGKL